MENNSELTTRAASGIFDWCRWKGSSGQADERVHLPWNVAPLNSPVAFSAAFLISFCTSVKVTLDDVWKTFSTSAVTSPTCILTVIVVCLFTMKKAHMGLSGQSFYPLVNRCTEKDHEVEFVWYKSTETQPASCLKHHKLILFTATHSSRLLSMK